MKADNRKPVKEPAKRSRSVTIRTNSPEDDVSEWLETVSDARLHRLNVLVNAEGQRRGWSPYWDE